MLESSIDELIDSTEVLMSFLDILNVSQISNDTDNSTINISRLTVSVIIGIVISVCVVVILTVVVVTAIIYYLYKQQKHR